MFKPMGHQCPLGVKGLETAQILFLKPQLETHYKFLSSLLSQPGALAISKFFITYDMSY